MRATTEHTARWTPGQDNLRRDRPVNACDDRCPIGRLVHRARSVTAADSADGADANAAFRGLTADSGSIGDALEARREEAPGVLTRD
jgi:hypothetical protein